MGQCMGASILGDDSFSLANTFGTNLVLEQFLHLLMILYCASYLIWKITIAFILLIFGAMSPLSMVKLVLSF